MREVEVKSIIGKKNWEAFLDWMRGQTVGMYPDGEADFYPVDVHAFKDVLRGKPDRQKDPNRWD